MQPEAPAEKDKLATLPAA